MDLALFQVGPSKQGYWVLFNNISMSYSPALPKWPLLARGERERYSLIVSYRASGEYCVEFFSCVLFFFYKIHEAGSGVFAGIHVW